MATHSSVLAWSIPWTEEPRGLQSMDHKQVDTTQQLSMQAQPDREGLTFGVCHAHVKWTYEMTAVGTSTGWEEGRK